MIFGVLHKVRTLEEVNELALELDLLLTSIYESGERGFDSVLKHKVRSWVALNIATEVAGSKLSKEAYLKQLKATLEQLAKVDMTIAFEPTDAFIDEILHFLRGVLGESVVIDLKVDKSLLGGVLVSYKGKYKDFSLLKVFNNEAPQLDGLIVERLAK